MLDMRTVNDMFTMLSGLSRDQARTHAFLCKLASDEIYNSLTCPDCVKENMASLCSAAGALAFYRFVLVEASSENVTSATLGNLKINQNNHDRVESAALVRDEYMKNIAHLLKTNDFVFMSTAWPGFKADGCTHNEKDWWE